VSLSLLRQRQLLFPLFYQFSHINTAENRWFDLGGNHDPTNDHDYTEYMALFVVLD
jgi:hypothetical protein